MRFEDGSRVWYYPSELGFSRGTHDWEQVTKTVSWGKNITQVRPYCLVYRGCTGTAWFDDISVIASGGAAKRVADGKSGEGDQGDALLTPFALLQSRPNPFNPETLIEYHLPEEGLVSLKVYNLLGQEIRMLEQGRKAAGAYHVHWDGRDEQGHPVSSGIYFYRMKVEDFVETKKMLMLR